MRPFVPRFAFLLRLLCRGRLRTINKLKACGTIEDDGCVFRGNAVETCEHLFRGLGASQVEFCSVQTNDAILINFGMNSDKLKLVNSYC